MRHEIISLPIKTACPQLYVRFEAKKKEIEEISITIIIPLISDEVKFT